MINPNDPAMAATIRQRFESVTGRVRAKAIACGREAGDIKVIAVSKFHPVAVVVEGIEAGIERFGENYVQEMKDKHDALASRGIVQPEWHFIGHLQTNKVKYIAPFVDIIHSVDSLHLASEISARLGQAGRSAKILLQVNTSGERSKSGAEPDQLLELASQSMQVRNVELAGLMTIGSFSEDESIIRREFRLLRGLRDVVQREFDIPGFHHLSMGMTHDFEIAIEEGATLLRIGTAIFGERHYS